MKVAFLRGEGRFPVMSLGGISPFCSVQCCRWRGRGGAKRVAIYTAALTGSRVLILVDA